LVSSQSPASTSTTTTTTVNLSNTTNLTTTPLPSPSLLPSITVTNNILDSYTNCACAALVKCPPCGVTSFTSVSAACPCAPKPNCPVCPRVSLVHELAAKKAREDQKLISNLRGIANSMGKILDNMNKYSNEVEKNELRAKEMAKKMEEASLNAENARRNSLRVNYFKNYYNIFFLIFIFQMNQQAKLIARQTLSACAGSNCSPNAVNTASIDFGMNKIFPKEVESLKTGRSKKRKVTVTADQVESSELNLLA